MRISVFPKSGGNDASAVTGNRVELNAASVLRLPIGPEEVAKFDRQGNDLILVLKDGSTLHIQNFFVVTEAGRNDLVFEDENGVTWWAQYGETWSGFDIAEVSEGDIPLLIPPVLPAATGVQPAALAGLAAVGGGGALALGGNTAPVGAADPVTTEEDTPIRGRVTGTDEDEDTLTFSLRRDAEHGTVVVRPDGSYVYTPDADYNGPDSFRVTVDDGRGETDIVTVQVTVTPVNDPPVGVVAPLVTPEDTAGGGQVIASDVDGDSVTITLATTPDHGSVTLNPDGTYTYTPVADYNGPDSFDVLLEDGNGGATIVTVPITVTPVNDPPVGSAAPLVTPEDTPEDGQIVASDVDGDTLTYTVATDPSNGSVVLNSDGSYTYTPDADYNGPDSFDVLVDDGNGGTTTVTVAVTVTPVNDPPVGSAVRLVVAEDTSGNGQVVASDVDGDSLTYSVTSGPTNGSVVLNADGSYTYTPDADYNGPDSFNVLVDDGNGGTTTVTVPITVTPESDAATITGTATGAVVEAGGVANATPGTPSASGTLTVTDPDAGEAVFRTPSSLAGTYGTFTFNATTGAWSYTLDNTRAATQALRQDQTETDELEVTSYDGSASETIVVTVTGTNDVPVVTDDTGAVTEDDDGGAGVLTTSGQVTIADVDAGQSSFNVSSLSPSGTPLGSLTIDADGNWNYSVDNTLTGIQSLAEGETLTETWTVVSADGTATSTIVVTVTGTNDAPNITGVAAGTVTEDITTSVSGQLADGDVDTSDTMIWSVVDGAGDYGTLSVDSTGRWTYLLSNANSDVQGLRNGETLSETFRVRVTDDENESDEQVVSITINGTNDAPVIVAGGDTSGAVTELSDGHASENSFEHSQSGTLVVTDRDTTDSYSVSAAAQGGSYLGTFTPVVNATTGNVDWTFTVDDADLDGLSEGETLTQSYVVTVTDLAGATDTETVTVVITGANDRPEPEDDGTIIAQGGGNAVRNVTTNDDDDDDGEAATLQVTSVAGEPITAGGSITLTGGLGTVSLAVDGQTLTFVPGPSASGEIVLSYTVDDGSGATNATATADWVVNIASVDVVDDASRAGPTTGDNVLSSVDDLTEVSISGHAAPGGSITALRISDGTLTVTPSASAIVVNADGSYSLDVDLSGLDDGTLTVTAEIEDAFGNPITVTDTILKDTITAVSIDPVRIEEGIAPTITGTGEASADITLTVDGSIYTTTVASNGTWSVTLPAALGTGDTSISVSAVDLYGNTDTDARSVTGLVVTDEVGGQVEDIFVSETALTGGTDEGSGADSTSSTFALGTLAPALDHITIDGTVVTLAQLAAAATTPVDVSTSYGILTITGFDGASGVIDYTYRLSSNTEDHSDVSANDILRDTIEIEVVETDDDTRVSELVVAIEDDAPETPQDDTPVSVVEGGTAVGSSNGGDNLLTNDVLGADGGRVYMIAYTNASGGGATEVIPDGGSATVTTRYGSLTVASDGTWSYTPDDAVDHVQPGNDTALTDDFSYSTIDEDGDISTSRATQSITITDTVPVLGTPENSVVDEENLATGTNPDADELSQQGTLNLTRGADDTDIVFTTTSPPADLQSGGVDIVYSVSPDGHSLIAHTGDPADPVFVVTLTNPTSGSAGYRFDLVRPLDHAPGGSLDLDFTVQATDADGDATLPATFTVEVIDDVAAPAVTRTIDEDSPTGFTANMSADANGGNTVIEQGGSAIVGTPVAGGTEYKTEHGTVTISADARITYVPDPNFSGQEVFDAVTADDGVSGSTTFTVNVTPIADAATVTVDAAAINTLEDTAILLGLNAPVINDDGTGTGNNIVSERISAITLSGLPVGATLDWVTGSYTVLTTGAITVELTDPGLSEINVTGDLSMTSAEFEAMTVLPPEHDATNFRVTYRVTSYEVDATGERLAGVSGASSQTSVLVYVEAVTDAASLAFDTSVPATSVTNADAISYVSTTEADITLQEDTAVDISAILQASFADLDGSEIRSFTITNTTGTDIVVNGTIVEVGAAASFDIAAPGLSGSQSAFPAISIGGTANFSGDLEGIEITLNAQDFDADGFQSDTRAGAEGQAEANLGDNTVTLNLYVTPVADDLVVENASGQEDSPIAFLAGVSLSDTSSGTGGSEVITQISFTVPTGWVVDAPSSVPAGVAASAGQVGSTYTITFTGGDQADREAYLDDFRITPPAHSSANGTIVLDITTRDTATVGGNEVFDETTEPYTLTVVVNEVPESFNPDGSTQDSDGNGTPDLTMTPGTIYSTPAEEDAWFALSRDGFDLSAGWSNEDTSEATFARLTPTLTAGDGSETSAEGSMFRWSEDGGLTWVAETYAGSPVDVPIEYLATLQFLAVEDFSGQFDIRVQALTVDYNDNSPFGGNDYTTRVSGEAFLSNVLITPLADTVTLSLAARAQGLEDTDIPLVIRPTSSDPSETFNVTISNIPGGSVITYGGVVQTITGGTLFIEDFDGSQPMTLRPPLNSNDDFQLTVSAQSVDRLDVDGVIYEDSSDAVTLTMQVEVRGIADAAVVTVTPTTYIEADIDSGADTVALSDLVSVVRTDTDGSEALTMQISGLPDGFSLSQGTLLTGPDVTGEQRIWVLRSAQVPTTDILVPRNFSGVVDFSLRPVTTENDGSSLTGGAQTVSFTITPSPEATVTTSAVLVEDTLETIGMQIAYRNGDTDETLAGLRIRVSDITGADFTLYIGASGSEQELSAAGLPVVSEGGVDYYELTAAQAIQLKALGNAHLDGSLGGFDLLYRITDPGDGTVTPVTSDWTPGRFDLTATPQTDAPVLTRDTIDVGGGVGGSATGNDVTVDVADTAVTLNMNVSTPDDDGSEHLVRVILSGVPDGVSVEGGELYGANTWLIILEGVNAQSIGVGGLSLPVVFSVGPGAAGVTDAPISITVQTQDRGNTNLPGTAIVEDSFTWTLTTTFAGSAEYSPPSIDEWAYNGTPASEDTEFTLADMIDATVTLRDNAASVLTVTVTGLPAQTYVEGMTRTVIQGQVTWTASLLTDPSDDAADVQARLDALMERITFTTPLNSNDNNAAPFTFEATLNSAVAGGGASELLTINPVIPVNPVTDPADISISLGASDADGILNESDTEIPITILVSNLPDGANGAVVDGEIYLQIDGTNGLGSGELTVGSDTYSPVAVSGVPGIPDGTYYVVDNVTMGVPLDIVFTPDAMTSGQLTVDSWVRNIETGSVIETPTASQVFEVELSNDGVSLLSSGTILGDEAADNSNDSLIELDISLQLTDNDGSEEIITVLLSNLPAGFLLYTGTSAGDASLAELAVNAGGTGNTNTWVLAGDGDALPPYVAILPPQHWSGTLTDLELSITSGEQTLVEKRVDIIELGDVVIAPVANGLTLTPTTSFGIEGNIIPLNLNAAMADFENASVAGAPDTSQETVTLTLQGLGEFAAFYIDGSLVTAGVSYASATDTYTLTGLSQEDLDDLGFIQAAAALTDQAAGTSGTQIAVTARTVDGTDISADTTAYATVRLTAQLGTSGNDSLIWTGQVLNARGGEDTVSFRYGESLSGTELSANLTNVETLALGIDGANDITDLTPEQVRTMTDGDNLLAITGTAADSVSFSGNWIDNGDGTYTGVPAIGAEVTVTVTDVTVDAPAGGWYTPPAPTMMSFSSFGAFGLASIDAGSAVEEDPAADETDPVTYEEVMSSGEEEDLTSGLPDEDSTSGDGGSGTTEEAPADWSGAATDDDLSQPVTYEV